VYRRPLADRYPQFLGTWPRSELCSSPLGLFNEHQALLPAAEDNEWEYRALRAGIPTVYTPEVAVRHMDWRSTEKLAATYRRYTRGQGGFYRLHIRSRHWLIVRTDVTDPLRGLLLLRRGQHPDDGNRETLKRRRSPSLTPTLPAVPAELTSRRP
jgi:hypothetical protein